MRLPSVDTAVREARQTFARFPLALLSAFLAAGTAMWMIDGPSDDAQPRLLATAVLGVALFTATVTSAERRGIASRHRWPVDLALALGLALLFRGSLHWTPDHAALRFAQLLVAAHLLVAIAPYRLVERLHGFWQFNRILFLRYLIGVIYVAVLWAGLAVAIAALDKLFGVKVHGEAYGYLFAALAFVFHPWFFLSGVPRDFAGLDARDDYPTGLKVFTQFVLMPLVVVYLAILTAYLGKVLITRTWPNGWIGYLVSSVSATGVLALLLVHPLRERADSRWVNAYGRWWFIALLPSLGMLLAAIGQRVGQYGITEPRYFLLVLALWLSGLALFYGISASRNITLIPMTLCAVALLTTMGPWSAYAVSRRSQMNRFTSILAANGMGRAGAPTRAAGPVSATDRRELSAVLRYLGSSHGPEAIADALGVPVDSARAWGDSAGYLGQDLPAIRAMDRLGVRYADRYTPAGPGDHFWANSPEPRSLDVTGFEVARIFSFPATTWIGTAADSIEVVRADSSGALAVRREGAVLFTLDLPGVLRTVFAADSLGTGRGIRLASPIVVEGEGAGYRVRLVLDNINGQLTDTAVVWQSMSGMLLGAGFKQR